MNFLDVRTVILSHFVTDAVCTAVLAFLWMQNRKRFAGLSYWLMDFVFQTTAVLLIVLRGSIPDWISIGFSNSLVIAGAILGYIGLSAFVEKRGSQIHNYILMAAFVAVHYFFAFIQPNLAARNFLLSLGLLIVCFQCAWLMLRRVEHGSRQMTRGVGLVFGVFCLVSIIRLAVILVIPNPSNDFFQDGLYDTLLLMAYQILLILLTFALSLMVNRRLIGDVQTQEEKFSKAFRSSPYAITLTRMSDGKIRDVNDGFAAITGYPPAEVIGKTTLELHLWAREADRAAVVSELSKGGRVVGRESHFRKKSGEIMIGLFSAEVIKINDQPWILSSISDITERKWAEETLRESEQKYRLLFDEMLSGIAVHEIICDPAGNPVDYRFLSANAAFEKMTGLKSAAIIGKTVKEVLPATEAIWIERYGKVALTRIPDHFEDYSSALGRYFEVRAFCPEKGKFAAIFNDITERKQAENLIQARLRLIEFAAHHSLDELLQKTLDEVCEMIDSPIGFYHFVEADQKTLSLQAWSTRTLQEYCKAEGRGLHYSVDEAGVWVDCIYKKQAVIHNDYASLPHRKGLPAGHAQLTRELVVPILREGAVVAILGVGNKAQEYTQNDIDIIAYFADIAWEIARRKRAEQQLADYAGQLEQKVAERTHELRAAQEQLVRQEKLAVLGQLAGGIGHELRNPLGVISGAVYFLKMALPEANHKIHEYLDMIETEVKTSDKIIGDLLGFARAKSVERAPSKVESLVTKVLERHIPPQHVTLHLDLPADLPLVLVDAGQIEQVLTNLVVNAYQAMPEGGQLSIIGRQLSVRSERATADSRMTDHWLLLTVQDTGVGIPPENMSKLFEPLFTTKIKGIGLGLAVSRKLIEANRGRIEAESVLGKGSVFTLYLPVVQEEK